MNGPNIPVRDKPFQECWKELVAFWTDWNGRGMQECEEKQSCARCAALFDIDGGKLKVRNEFCKKRKGYMIWVK